MKDKKVTTTKAGSWLNEGYHEGDWITRSEGLEGNGRYVISNISGTVMTIRRPTRFERFKKWVGTKARKLVTMFREEPPS